MTTVHGQRIGLLINPTAGKHRGEQVGTRIADLLEAGGRDVVDLTGLDASRAQTKALAAVESGDIDMLVVAGGDGAAGLGANICAGTDVPLGIVAVGTGNDNARELGLPVQDVDASVDRILNGQTRRMDLGRVLGDDGQRVRDYLGVLSCGFDAVVNERANTMVWPRGPQRYNLAILRELPVFGSIRYQLTIDGAEREVDGMLVCIANGRAFGGGMKVAPAADVEDGLLDVVIVHDIPMSTFLSVFPKVFKGTHTSHPAVEIIRGARIHIATDRIVSYADGERVAPLPLTVEAAPGALLMVR